MTDGASLYVHCRSWLRNGVPEECQVGMRFFFCNNLCFAFILRIQYLMIFCKPNLCSDIA